MYESYWRLDSKPFENTPDPRFLYYSSKHEEALMRLLYATRENKQGAILTGDYGSGKTVLSRVLLQDLGSDERFQTVLIVNPKIAKKELLKEILFQLGVHETSPIQDEVELLRLLEQKLKQYGQLKKRTVIIIDEAQILEEKELEEIRLLLNFQSQEDFLLTLILIGQSDLKKKVQNIVPLKQRLAFRFHLEPLDTNETYEYINHRLLIAGKKGELFSPGAVGLIYEGSRGIPRQINNICDYALLIGFSNKVSNIGIGIVEDCLKDLDLSAEKSPEEAAAQPEPVLPDRVAPDRVSPGPKREQQPEGRLPEENLLEASRPEMDSPEKEYGPYSRHPEEKSPGEREREKGREPTPAAQPAWSPKTPYFTKGKRI